MASKADVTTIDAQGKVERKPRFDAQDWSLLAEYVLDTHATRRSNRKPLERQWDEIDRQIAMEPDIQFKRMANGTIDTRKKWMAEMELPLQAQAQEVLTADARRLMFGKPWFEAHSEVTDEYLDKIDFEGIILGDENDVPSSINQENADELVRGFLMHFFRQMDFETRQDRINAECLIYGMGVGRGRMETKKVWIHEARGVRTDTQRMPVLVPSTIRRTYLDEPISSTHSSQVLGAAHIAEDHMKLANIQLAANKGSTDPDDEDGGWMPNNVKKLEADDNGFVTVLEMEGDIVIPRKTVRSIVIPGAIVTVACGPMKDDVQSKAVIRFRFRKQPFSSYILYPYNYEGTQESYSTSPLMKGRPIQIMAVDALNRLMDSGALKNAPPVGWDGTGSAFAGTGGPVIEPYAIWESLDGVQVYNQVGGDPAALANVFSVAVNLYGELTGVLPARLGAQTVSHTTAFAKEAELQRGASRTVDFVDQIGKGAMTRWLDMAYVMGRDSLGSSPISFYIDAYGGFVEVTKQQLPEKAIFEWFGAGGPQDEAQTNARKLQSLQLALQMDQLAAQSGQPPTVNVAAATREVLRDGGWTDVDSIARPAGIDEAASGVPGPAEANPGAATVALQSIAGAGR